MPDSTTAVILSAVRTPIGKYLGGLSALPAPRLGAVVIREAVRRAGIDAGAVEQVIMGNVLQGGVGQAPGRQAAIHGGLWDSFSNTHMGNLAEYTAKKAGVARADQDAFALASHQKAVAAMEACRFKAETIPVELPGKQGPMVVEKD